MDSPHLLFEHLPRRRFGIFDRRALDEQAGALLTRVGLGDLSPRTPVERLGIAQMQMVEIARALSREGKILVLDEPTATLTPREADHLLVQIRALKARGMTLIYVSHHLGDMFKLYDRVTVLRNGAKVDHLPLAGAVHASDALAGSGILDVAAAIPRQPTDVERVVEEPRSAPELAADRRVAHERSPGPGDALSVELVRQAARQPAGGIVREIRRTNSASLALIRRSPASRAPGTGGTTSVP